ncbi:sigma-70 family RNA polymerase sigma factor [Pararhizobium arenae]|uniref:sigma-70 family RNA polymerase sigma factor n=1 Tax=Pararhizobium arenae TaxID=1856850 RepID=UPI00094B1123|nr:sigma-70 family RNA polymerase sigma factor [Pararhizobium arenae]
MSLDAQKLNLHSDIVNLMPALRAFARRFHRTQHDADDLVQETLVRALANCEKFQHGTNLKSWLFTIMRNTFCTKFGIAKREAPGSGTCVADQPTINPPQEWSIQVLEFNEAYDRLPAHFREALDIVAIQGDSYEVAAERCGCPIGTIKSRVSRARILLANELGQPF